MDLFVIKAVCLAGCLNGGNCTSSEMCTCPGNDCRQDINDNYT